MFGKKRDPDNAVERDEKRPPEVEGKTGDPHPVGPVDDAGRDESGASAGAGKDSGDEGEDWKARYLESLAELQNVRKRTEREREQMRKYAVEGMMRDLLGVLDALQAASDAEGDMEAIRDGIRLARQELLRVLHDKGLTPIDAAGQHFDPRLHEAMGMIPTAEAKPGTVINELSRGYTLHDRVLRASKVQVAAAPPESSGDKGSSGDTESSGDTGSSGGDED